MYMYECLILVSFILSPSFPVNTGPPRPKKSQEIVTSNKCKIRMPILAKDHGVNNTRKSFDTKCNNIHIHITIYKSI